ncbi:MAG: cytochrome c1 [Hyphomicrobiaceae bacterium]|nr:cytochrome c1 [Hyphomicrobiaceae bacterium]
MTVKTVLRAAAGLSIVGGLAAGAAMAAGGGGPTIEQQKWSFGGVRGHFDRAQLQRGFQVYKEVCASCHSMNRISFRNLSQPGGPEFPEDGVKNLASTYQVVDGPNDQGKMLKRPAKPSDPIPSPFDNEQQARSANNGALPPNLSLIARARGIEVEKPFWMVPVHMVKDIGTGYQEAGADYVFALLTGYADVPAYKNENGHLVLIPAAQAKGDKAALRCATVDRGEPGKPDVCNKLGDGMNYNVYFPGNQIAMAPPLQDGQLKYSDKSPETVAQYAKDFAAFSAWAADPKLEERKRIGLMSMLYLLITTVLLYFAKKRIWSKVPH